jgi:hypothetical protein
MSKRTFVISGTSFEEVEWINGEPVPLAGNLRGGQFQTDFGCMRKIHFTMFSDGVRPHISCYNGEMTHHFDDKDEFWGDSVAFLPIPEVQFMKHTYFRFLVFMRLPTFASMSYTGLGTGATTTEKKWVPKHLRPPTQAAQ